MKKTAKKPQIRDLTQKKGALKKVKGGALIRPIFSAKDPCASSCKHYGHTNANDSPVMS
jgi:hypothetical protein